MPQAEASSGDSIAKARTGDFIFRSGTGYRAHAVQAVSLDRLSHVGLIWRNTNGGLEVIHAAPPDHLREGSVRRETLASFLAEEGATSAAIYRPAETPAQLAERAAGKAIKLADAQVPFDDDFDLADVDKLYCTELIWRAYALAGLRWQPIQTRLHIGLVSQSYMTPADLIRMTRAEKLGDLRPI